MRRFFALPAWPLMAAIVTAPITGSAAAEQSGIEIRRQFVDGPFGQIHVRIAKPIGVAETNLKTPLILFHSTPYSSDYYLPFIPHIATDRTVIAMDTPGFGASARPPEMPTIADYAAAGAAALDALGYIDRPVDAMGYHTGTFIAAELAAAYPDKVRRLVLPGVPFYLGDARQATLERTTVPDEIKADGSHLGPKWEFVEYALKNGVSLERAQEHFADLMQSYPFSWWAYNAVFTWPAEERLKLVEQPVRLISINGSLKDETKAAQDYLPNAEHIYREEMTGSIFDLHPETLAELTREFLDR